MTKSIMYNGKKTMIAEDCTPTWSTVVEIYMAAIENSGCESAKHEIRRMAKLADERNQIVKSNSKKK